MSKKPLINIKIDEQEPVVIPSLDKKKYLAFMEAYKRQNPVKYELKRKKFEAKLATFDN